MRLWQRSEGNVGRAGRGGLTSLGSRCRWQWSCLRTTRHNDAKRGRNSLASLQKLYC
ncbi:hypothetical protein B0O99DRAFT_643546 [Bisporella sp. PMI_857]|nr:hypothetical protein B0O99DRAFT_643546 [Bisporella sp. PMI_857]